MKHYELLEQGKDWRLVLIPDETISTEDLKGDMFDPSANPDMSEFSLKLEERAFEQRVMNEGVYIAVLQRWNPAPNHGWETIDSIGGLIGGIKDYPEYVQDLFHQADIDRTA